MTLTAAISDVETNPDTARNQSGTSAVGLRTRAVSGEEWDATIATFDGVVQEQLHAFTVRRWPQVRAEMNLFYSGEMLVGGALVMLQPLPLGLGAIAVSKWGPMLKDGDAPDREARYMDMVEALIADYAEKRGLMLSVLPRASLTRSNPAYDLLISRGFKPGATLAFPSRYVVDVRLSDAEQRKSFHQKWRYHLNKAEKSGLSFEHGGPERFGEFAALYAAMSDRKQFPDFSAYETIPDLLALPVPELRPELFFVRHDGEVVAGAVIFKAGKTAVYLYGATNDKALPLRAGYFMQARIISWLRENTSADWYDLGGTDGYQGLYQFKKGLVGEAGVITPVPRVANYAARPLPMLIGQGAFWARDMVNGLKRVLSSGLNPKSRPTQVEPDAQYPGP